MYQAFQDCPRPEHFTNFHCEECAEHDDTLLSRTPDTITRQDVEASNLTMHASLMTR